MKLYPSYFEISQDTNILMEFYRLDNILQSNGITKDFKKGLRELSNSIRDSLNINKVIGLIVDEKEKRVIIPVYNVVVEGKYYKSHFDEEKGLPYIALEES